MLYAGTASAVITPGNGTTPTYLDGIGDAKTRLAGSTLDELRVRVVWLERDGKNLIIINADLLYIPFRLYEEMRKWLRDELRLRNGCLIFNATHTHSAPCLGQTESEEQQAPYGDYLKKRTKQALKDAFSSMEPCRLFLGKTICTIGTNRRRKIIRTEQLKALRLGRAFANRPNPFAVTDPELIVLKIWKGGRWDVCIVNYACHPSILRGCLISADFPGRVADWIGNRLGRHITVLFLQGFGGNIRPNLLGPKPSLRTNPKEWIVERIEGRRFKKDGSEQDIVSIGAAIGKSILAIREEDYREIDVHLSWKEKTIDLPLKRALVESKSPCATVSPDRRLPGSSVGTGEGSPGDRVVPITIQRVDLSREVSFLCVPGEVFCEYSLSLKKILHSREIIALGCTNGMVGYIPTDEAIREGGYETARAYRFYGQADPFSEGIERAFSDGVRSLFEIPG